MVIFENEKVKFSWKAKKDMLKVFLADGVLSGVDVVEDGIYLKYENDKSNFYNIVLQQEETDFLTSGLICKDDEKNGNLFFFSKVKSKNEPQTRFYITDCLKSLSGTNYTN